MSILPPLSPAQEAYIATLRLGDLAQANHLEQRLEHAWLKREQRLTQPQALLAAAVYYATNRHPVFPLQPGSKQPFPHSRGFKDATTDPEQIREWWGIEPAANIGIATGHSIDVVDCDGAQGLNNFTWADAATSGSSLRAIVNTPHGLHYWFHPEGLPTTQATRPGVDLRGIGGYVVAPPSQITCTKQDCENPFPHVYRFQDGYELH